ncbi:MAG: MlaD family protein [bacterium]|nr:MlaD family protein [bacterium]
MKLSSTFKVGILSLISLAILLFTILWVKGRSFSSAERIEVHFKDVNGMRPGSGVQMMGLRVGQVEEITPVMEGESSYVKLKFVITEPNISIPKASLLTIQQSGLIGEQFLEITPPKINSVYLPVTGELLISDDSDVEILLDGKYYNVGKVKKSQIMSTQTVPESVREFIKTSYAYRVDYCINLPGLIIPMFMTGQVVTSDGIKKLRITPLDKTPLPYPHQTSPYTVVEPMRISDFMDLQYKAAESLTETNRAVNELLNDSVIADITKTISNVRTLTAQATTTLEKAEKLIDTSKNDLDAMLWMLSDATNNFNKLAVNINGIVADEKFKPTMYETAEAITKISNSLSPVIGSVDAKEFAEDLNGLMNNLNEISSSVNSMTKDENLKKKIVTSVDNLNLAMCEVSNALETINGSTGNQENLKNIMKDTTITISNLKKFSEKLNKRFLLFRLMF